VLGLWRSSVVHIAKSPRPRLAVAGAGAGVVEEVMPERLHVAYADPPYIGKAKRYGEEEVDFESLILGLDTFDGWALSCNSNDLFAILPLCPDGVRIMAWVKTWVAFKKNVWPPYGWEPVLVKAARRRDLDAGAYWTPHGDGFRDWVKAGANLNGFLGSKPPEFCGWLFEVLGCEPDDHFYDLFYGSGAVTRAWKQWSSGAMRAPLFVKESP